MKNLDESIDTSSETAVDLFACLTAIMMVLTTIYIKDSIKIDTSINDQETNKFIFIFNSESDREKYENSIKSIVGSSLKSTNLSLVLDITNDIRIDKPTSFKMDEKKFLIPAIKLSFMEVILGNYPSYTNIINNTNKLSNFTIDSITKNSGITSIDFHIRDEEAVSMFEGGHISCNDERECTLTRNYGTRATYNHPIENDRIFYGFCPMIDQNIERSTGNGSRGSRSIARLKTSEPQTLETILTCLSRPSQDLPIPGFSYQILNLKTKEKFNVQPDQCVHLTQGSISLSSDCSQ